MEMLMLTDGVAGRVGEEPAASGINETDVSDDDQ